MRNQWVLIFDGKDVVSENINIELVYAMADIIEKYYPGSVNKAVALDYPEFLLDIGRDLMKTLSAEFNNVVFLSIAFHN